MLASISYAQPCRQLAREAGIDVNYLGQSSTERLSDVTLEGTAVCKASCIQHRVHALLPGFDAYPACQGLPTKCAAKLCENQQSNWLTSWQLQSTAIAVSARVSVCTPIQGSARTDSALACRGLLSQVQDGDWYWEGCGLW